MSTLPSPAALTVAAVGGTSVTIAQQNLSRVGLFIFNCSATATLWVSPLNVPAVVGGSGSIAIQPLQGMMLGSSVAGRDMPPWINGVNAISSAGPQAVTVLEFYP